MRRKYLLLCAQAYVHAQSTPLFWLVHSKQVADFTGTFKCGKWQYKWWFFVYFWKIKGTNLQNNGVWRMVHHKLMYERGSWMGLSAWTLFIPSGCALGHKQSFMSAMVQIFSWGERWNDPFNEVNGTFHLSPNENICSIARIRIHYLFYLTCTKIQILKQI